MDEKVGRHGGVSLREEEELRTVMSMSMVGSEEEQVWKSPLRTALHDLWCFCFFLCDHVHLGWV